MENSVTQRIKDYLQFKRWTVNSLSKSMKMTQATLNRQITEVSALSADTLTGLLSVFPELSAEWLLRGIGQMESVPSTTDPELKAVCIDQAKEIYRLKMRLAELEGEKKLA